MWDMATGNHDERGLASFVGTFNYINMRFIQVNMRLIHDNMRLLYVIMQHNLNRMLTQLCCM